MVTFIAKRIIFLIPILLGTSLITFLLLQLVPGDPAEVYLRISQIPPTDEAVKAIRQEMGLNKPLLFQYVQWLKGAVLLNFGESFVTKKPVLEEVLYYFPSTLQLTLAATVFTITVSIPLGILSTIFKNRLFDKVTRVLSIIGNSMPSFWLGFILLFIFSLKFNLLPSHGKGSFSHLILPLLTLSIPYIAIYTRLLRTSLLENMNQPFVLFGRARGLKKRLIFGKHVLKHALLPLITSFGVSVGYLISGTVIVESIFSWPGLGRFFVSAILNRDYPVIQFYILLMAIIFAIINLIVDVIYAYIDPRIRWNRKGR